MAVKGSDQPAEINRARRVQRGQVDISARIDLHGMTQAEADRRLPQFVAAQRGQGARCILIITGKGRGGQGVLRRNFLAWLSQPSARAHVSAYAPAHARHGGGGAFYVFLRRRA
ncbi:MAG: Smr/MutS family protein [Pseudomonadota bacterium]